MFDDKLDKYIATEICKYSSILERTFHDMMDIDFTVENGKMYILSARVGKRTSTANLKIIISMFCEGKISLDDTIKKLNYKQLEEILDLEILLNAYELKRLGTGLPASGGIGAATVCFSYSEASSHIVVKKEFIYCRIEVSPEDIDIMCSPYCKGVMTSRGGMTSHAAVVCRGIKLPCVSGFGEYDDMHNLIVAHEKQVTIDGNTGEIYAGIGKVKKEQNDLPEIKILFELLQLIITYNAIVPETASLVWRYWDVIVLGRRYKGCNNTKRLVIKNTSQYMSFIQPTKREINMIKQNLYVVENGNLIVEGLIEFLVTQLSAQVPLGSHFLYVRPLLDPMETMCLSETEVKRRGDPEGFQLTGMEFFHINQFVDFLIDIYSVKIFFNTGFYCEGETTNTCNQYFPLNYLDYTNPHGESLIINTYNTNEIAVYINDTLIPAVDLPVVYHLIRRRAYHWLWFKDNNITKNEIIHYLESYSYPEDGNTKMYHLCEDMHLIKDSSLTQAGISLLDQGGRNMELNKKNIDYILDSVSARGYNDNSSDCNDYVEMIKKKDFKELIALELYETYFWDERHEFDLQLLKELVENVSAYYSNPETIMQIKAGILQTLPSVIIVAMVNTIWNKMKNIVVKHRNSEDENSSWNRIEKNIKKIDHEFSSHDYVLTDEIERIFDSSREEIQPLLKLCGCKCFIDRKRSIWIKPGIQEEKVNKILKKHNFKYR